MVIVQSRGRQRINPCVRMIGIKGHRCGSFAVTFRFNRLIDRLSCRKTTTSDAYQDRQTTTQEAQKPFKDMVHGIACPNKISFQEFDFANGFFMYA